MRRHSVPALHHATHIQHPPEHSRSPFLSREMNGRLEVMDALYQQTFHNGRTVG
jgi:hypothetical protein